MLFTSDAIVESSAYFRCHGGASFINTEKHGGPSLVPWFTPHVRDRKDMAWRRACEPPHKILTGFFLDACGVVRSFAEVDENGSFTFI